MARVPSSHASDSGYDCKLFKFKENYRNLKIGDQIFMYKDSVYKSCLINSQGLDIPIDAFYNSELSYLPEPKEDTPYD